MTDEPIDINIAEALWRLEQLPGTEIPELATEALKIGFDGPALRELAGMYEPAAPEVAPLVEQALREMGREPLSKYEAGMRLARDIAEQMLTGEMEAYEGACEMSTIWVLGSSEERFEELEVFVSLSNEYEHYHQQTQLIDPLSAEKMKQECEISILTEAQNLVTQLEGD